MTSQCSSVLSSHEHVGQNTYNTTSVTHKACFLSLSAEIRMTKTMLQFCFSKGFQKALSTSVCVGCHSSQKGPQDVCACVYVCASAQTHLLVEVWKRVDMCLNTVLYINCNLTHSFPMTGHFWQGTPWMHTSSIKHTNVKKKISHLFYVFKCHVRTKSWNLVTNRWNLLHFLKEETCKSVRFAFKNSNQNLATQSISYDHL